MLFTQYDCPQTTCKEQFYVEYNFIAYVISGRRIFHKGEKSWNLQEGRCAFVKKGAHVAERLQNDAWCVMVFFIPDEFFKQLVNEHRKGLSLVKPMQSGDEHVLILDVNEISYSFFTSMLPYFSQSPPPLESLVELKFKELVLSLLNNRNNEHFLSYLNGLSNNYRQSIEEIMQGNFRFNLTMSQYASLASKSVPTFKRDFKKIFNDSPARWVTNRRLSLAKDLLVHSPLRIGEIAFECGFENQTHFSRIFKQRIGVSPVQFRSNVKLLK
jgi:AraC-like DNA-binding protein